MPMNTILRHIITAMIFVSISVGVGFAQSGGTYILTQSVIANGGGASSGGTFGVTGTNGQALAGTNSSGGGFGVTGGFWQPVFAPSAAMVAVSGRILTANGNGIRNVFVSLTDPGGTTRRTISSSFGYFRFDDVEAGQTYIISINSKRYVFTNPTQVISVSDEITDLVFTSEPQ